MQAHLYDPEAQRKQEERVLQQGVQENFLAALADNLQVGDSRAKYHRMYDRICICCKKNQVAAVGWLLLSQCSLLLVQVGHSFQCCYLQACTPIPVPAWI